MVHLVEPEKRETASESQFKAFKSFSLLRAPINGKMGASLGSWTSYLGLIHESPYLVGIARNIFFIVVA
jgi:hypothetical protein